MNHLEERHNKIAAARPKKKARQLAELREARRLEDLREQELLTMSRRGEDKDAIKRAKEKRLAQQLARQNHFQGFQYGFSSFAKIIPTEAEYKGQMKTQRKAGDKAKKKLKAKKKGNLK